MSDMYGVEAGSPCRPGGSLPSLSMLGVVGWGVDSLPDSRREYMRMKVEEQTGALRPSSTILFMTFPGLVSLQEQSNMTAICRSSSSGRRSTISITSLILLASCAPAVAQTSLTAAPDPLQEERGTIQVTGQAQIMVPSDLVRISFAVETEGASAGEATSQNAQQMEAVIAAVRSIGIPGMDIGTFGYNLRPEYEVSRDGTGTRTISGYRVENNILVTLPDVDATGGVLDRAVEAGANRVANLQFVASDTRTARLQALREAVASAREQAEIIAEAMGVQLGIALEVHGGANAPSPRAGGEIMFMADAAASTPIEAGNQIVRASVTVTYRIREGGSRDSKSSGPLLRNTRPAPTLSIPTRASGAVHMQSLLPRFGQPPLR